MDSTIFVLAASILSSFNIVSVEGKPPPTWDTVDGMIWYVLLLLPMQNDLSFVLPVMLLLSIIYSSPDAPETNMCHNTTMK